MNRVKLNSLENSTFNLLITARSIAFSLLMLGSLALCQSAAAQNLQPRPVARLMSDPIADARFSRPRRVTSEENSPVSVAESNAPRSLALNDANAIERRAFDQMNRARIENGISPLAWDAELYRMARVHSEQMAKEKFFSHETPEGLHLKERARANGLRHFRVIAENIAYNKGYDDPGGFAVERWMTSSGHRANMLYGGFQAAAIGSYVAADGSTYLTQVFIAR